MKCYSCIETGVSCSSDWNKILLKSLKIYCEIDCFVIRMQISSFMLFMMWCSDVKVLDTHNHPVQQLFSPNLYSLIPVWYLHFDYDYNWSSYIWTAGMTILFKHSHVVQKLRIPNMPYQMNETLNWDPVYQYQCFTPNILKNQIRKIRYCTFLKNLIRKIRYCNWIHLYPALSFISYPI